MQPPLIRHLFAIVGWKPGGPDSLLHHPTPMGDFPMIDCELEKLRRFFDSAEEICRAKGWLWRVVKYGRQGDTSKVSLGIAGNGRDDGGNVPYGVCR